jgi:DNA modification methylase
VSAPQIKTGEEAAVWFPLEDLLENPRNPRVNDHAVKQVSASIEQFGFGAPIVARKSNHMVIAGHTRLKAAKLLGWDKVPVRFLKLNSRKAEALMVADNKTGELAAWNEAELAALLQELEAEQIEVPGFEEGALERLLEELDPGSSEERGSISLAERFLVPPFSILDSRQGYWKKRRAEWLSLGIRSEIGRGSNLLKFSDTVLEPDPSKRGESQEGGTSIFDPVLCELAYRWFSPTGGSILDPFAGGSVRGIVASKCGRPYLGVDLRREQVEENRRQAAEILEDPGEEALGPKTRDPEAQTPIDLKGDCWVKRDDQFKIGCAGGKVRTCLHLAREAVGITTAGSRQSPQVNIVARIAKHLGIPCRVHVPRGDFTPELSSAQEAGAEVIQHNPGYNTVLISRAKKDADKRGWTEIPFGMECQEAVEQTRRQVLNIPEGVKRLVVSVGSGMSLAGILQGLEDRKGGRRIPVLGVMVGADPTSRLDAYAPEGWREWVTLVQSSQDFHAHAPRTTWRGIRVDSIYEGKCLPFLEAGDLFWIIGIRKTEEEAERQDQKEEEITPAPLEELKPWQQGIELEELKTITAVFKESDRGRILGAFTKVNEVQVAKAWSEGKLFVVRSEGRPVAVAIGSKVKTKAKTIKNFTGSRGVMLFKGSTHISRFAALEGFEGELLGLLQALGGEGPAFALEIWHESPRDRRIVEALGLDFGCLKIKASSEMFSVWTKGVTVQNLGARVSINPSSPDFPALARLASGIPVEAFAKAAEDPGEWADHYSSYNKRSTWSALALRSYGGSVDFIQKPDEMSRKWKAENPEKLEWLIHDTPLMAQLPEVDSILDQIPTSRFDRIRLMRLVPGGELGRHADITSGQEGTRDGELMRLHVPIATNEAVEFSSIDAGGRSTRAHMAVGEIWNLDTRKPHAARNGGSSDRIHLVIDCEATPEIREMFPVEPSEEILEDPAEESRRQWAHLEAVEMDKPDPEPLPSIKSSGNPSASAQDLSERRIVSPVPSSMGPMPEWIVGDSREALDPLEDEFDFLFTCPPYYNLEVYSDIAEDLSNAPTYDSFLEGFREVIEAGCSKLRNNRFACVVIGDIRDKKGFYRALISDTIDAFVDAGLSFYNEAILVNSLGTLPIRAGRVFASSRKLGKCHQNVLVFVKGDWRKAADACGEVDVSFLEEDLE